MQLNIQEADLKRDKPTIIETLLANLTPLSDEARFEWLYTRGPHGRARAWLAVDDEQDEVVGLAAAFPRRFHIAEEGIPVWVLGDCAINHRYRSLGPALQLQKACLAAAAAAGVTFCYDFPGRSMLAIYQRLGFGVTGKMLRLAKPLRVDRKVKEMVKNASAQRVLASVGNALLKRAASRAEVDESLEVAVHAQLCGDEFTLLAQAQRGSLGLCLDRSAAYLNWRYVSNPLARHEIVTARRDGRLVGYVVWTGGGEDASIVDFFGEQDSGMARRLVAEVATLAQDRGVMTLSVSLNESHPWLSLFCDMGFHLRDSVPVAMIPSKSLPHKINPQLTGWYLTQGDRDS